jgi:hypothetical protein
MLDPSLFPGALLPDTVISCHHRLAFASKTIEGRVPLHSFFFFFFFFCFFYFELKSLKKSGRQIQRFEVDKIEATTNTTHTLTYPQPQPPFIIPHNYNTINQSYYAMPAAKQKPQQHHQKKPGQNGQKHPQKSTNNNSSTTTTNLKATAPTTNSSKNLDAGLVASIASLAGEAAKLAPAVKTNSNTNNANSKGVKKHQYPNNKKNQQQQQQQQSPSPSTFKSQKQQQPSKPFKQHQRQKPQSAASSSSTQASSTTAPKPSPASTSKSTKPTTANVKRNVLLEEIKALGGSLEDFELLEDVLSGSEVEDNDASTLSPSKDETKKKGKKMDDLVGWTIIHAPLVSLLSGDLY